MEVESGVFVANHVGEQKIMTHCSVTPVVGSIMNRYITSINLDNPGNETWTVPALKVYKGEKIVIACASTSLSPMVNYGDAYCIFTNLSTHSATYFKVWSYYAPGTISDIPVIVMQTLEAPEDGYVWCASMQTNDSNYVTDTYITIYPADDAAVQIDAISVGDALMTRAVDGGFRCEKRLRLRPVKPLLAKTSEITITRDVDAKESERCESKREDRDLTDEVRSVSSRSSSITPMSRPIVKK